MAFRATWISVEQQSLSRASGTKSLRLNPFPGMNSWASLGGPSGTIGGVAANRRYAAIGKSVTNRK